MEERITISLTGQEIMKPRNLQFTSLHRTTEDDTGGVNAISTIQGGASEKLLAPSYCLRGCFIIGGTAFGGSSLT